MSKLISNKTFQSWLWLTTMLLIWELSAHLGLINTYILPPFSKVISRTASELFIGKLGINTINSIGTILIGFSICFLLVTIAVLLSVCFTFTESLFNMLCTVMTPLPSVAIMPLIIMWFGINSTAMLIIIVHGVLWAMLRHLLDGLRSVPTVYREWGENIGLSPWHRFTGILVFAIMPEILAGIRVGWGRAWRALISAELVFGTIGSFGGLGFYIHTNRAYANLTNVMAGVIIIAVIGILMESLLFKQIERHTIQKWGMTHE